MIYIASIWILLYSLLIPIHFANAEHAPTKKKPPTARRAPIIPDVPVDAIPPLDSPKYEDADKAKWLKKDDIVLGAEFGGDARAYPVKILNWHEIVNERIGGKEVVVTYCPLCRSGVVFDRHLDGKLLTFGNTGALYESDMVMYDHETKSLWFQVAGRAIGGKLEGKELSVAPSLLTTWKHWQELHPKSKVLSKDTGYRRDYEANHYRGYDRLDSAPAFPVSISDKRLQPKEKVIGLVVEGIAKAYPVRLARNTTLRDTLHGQVIEIVGDADGLAARVFFLSAPITCPNDRVHFCLPKIISIRRYHYYILGLRF